MFFKRIPADSSENRVSEWLQENPHEDGDTQLRVEYVLVIELTVLTFRSQSASVVLLVIFIIIYLFVDFFLIYLFIYLFIFRLFICLFIVKSLYLELAVISNIFIFLALRFLG